MKRLRDWFSSRGSRRREWAVIGLLTAVALVSRAYGIWSWPVTGDEYYTVAFAEDRTGGLLGSGYYVLVLLFRDLFGAAGWSARLPSVIMGTLAVPAVYGMTREILDRETAIAAALLVIAHGWLLHHAQMARYYAGVFLFGALAYYFYYRALDRDSYLDLGLFFVSVVGGLWFHATAIVLAAACALSTVALLVLARRRESVRTQISTRVARAHLAVSGVGLLIAAPVFLGIARTWGVHFTGVGLDSLRIFVSVLERVNVAVGVAALFGLALMLRRTIVPSTLFAVNVGIPMGAIYLWSILLPPVRDRYIMYCMPLIVALAAYLCARVSEELEEYRFARHGATVVLISVLLVGFVSHYTGRKSLDIRDPVHYACRHTDGNDVIVAFDLAITGMSWDRSCGAIESITSKRTWEKGLVPIAEQDRDAWIIVDTYRNPRMPDDLESWLMEHAELVWRREEKRFDYTNRGYEVWKLEGEGASTRSVGG